MMKETKFLLSDHDRQIVEATIHEHCELRKWDLHAVNARSNHVHVVVTAPEYQPETVASQFKAWCTKKLQADHPERNRFWTEGASCRWINVEKDLQSAIDYTVEAQDRMGLDRSQ